MIGRRQIKTTERNDWQFLMVGGAFHRNPKQTLSGLIEINLLLTII